MASLSRTSDAVVEPVSVQEALDWLRYSHADAATKVMLQQIITAARQYVEQVTGRALVQQTWTLTMATWPAGVSISLPRVPVSAVTAVKYYDTDDVQQTLSSSSYRLIATDDSASIELVSGASWPSASSRSDAVTVEFVAGYGTDGQDVPAGLRNAVLLLVAHLFDTPHAVSSDPVREVPLSLSALLDSYRVGVV